MSLTYERMTNSLGYMALLGEIRSLSNERKCKMSPKGSGHYTEASAEYERTRNTGRVVLSDGEIVSKSVRPSHERGDWAVYAWDSRGVKGWLIQPDCIGISLEIAITTMLRWKSQGQDVRMETIPA